MQEFYASAGNFMKKPRGTAGRFAFRAPAAAGNSPLIVVWAADIVEVVQRGRCGLAGLAGAFFKTARGWLRGGLGECRRRLAGHPAGICGQQRLDFYGVRGDRDLDRGRLMQAEDLLDARC